MKLTETAQADALLTFVLPRLSANMCSLFSLVNVAVILFMSTYGLWFAELSNWNVFTPYGVSGLLSGASSCFFAFAGIDSIAIAAEEAREPGQCCWRGQRAGTMLLERPASRDSAAGEARERGQCCWNCW